MLVRLSSVALLFTISLLRVCAFSEEDCPLSLLQTGALLQRPGQVGQVGSDFFEIADPSLEAAARAGPSERRASAASAAPFDVGSDAVPVPRGFIVTEPKLARNLLSLAEVASRKEEEQQADAPSAASFEVLESEPPLPLASAFAKAPMVPILQRSAQKAPQSQEVLESLLTQQRKVGKQDFEDNENPADFVEHEASAGTSVYAQLGTATAADKADTLKLAAAEKAAAIRAVAAERKAVEKVVAERKAAARAAIEEAVAERAEVLESTIETAAANRVAAESAEALRLWRKTHGSPHHRAQRQQPSWRRKQASPDHRAQRRPRYTSVQGEAGLGMNEDDSRPEGGLERLERVSVDRTMERLEEDEKTLLTALQSKQELQADGLDSSRKVGCGPDDDGNDSGNPC